MSHARLHASQALSLSLDACDDFNFFQMGTCEQNILIRYIFVYHIAQPEEVKQEQKQKKMKRMV